MDMMFRYIKTDLKVPVHKEAWMFITPPNPMVHLPKNCRECNKLLADESCVRYLASGGYCEKCYNYWYAYGKKRFTEDQALCRDLGMWPYGFRPNTGMIDFKMPSKKSEKYGRIWNRHPSDWPEETKRFLKPDQILIDGENFPPELVAARKAKEAIAN